MTETIARINQLTKEGLDGVTPRDTIPDKAMNLEGKIQADYFSDIRNSFDTYASSRVMEVGKDEEASRIFKELFGVTESLYHESEM